MSLPDFDYVAPISFREVLGILADRGASGRLIGGGTDVLPSMRHGLVRPDTLVSLARVPGSTRIEVEADGTLHLGPSVRLRQLESDPAVTERFPLLKQAAHAVGSPQLREMGTVAGNLLLEPRCCFYNRSAFWRSCRPACLKAGGEMCNAVGGGTKCFAVFCGDLAPALVALGARVTATSPRGERCFALEELYLGDGLHSSTLGQDEILTEVIVPAPQPGTVGTYLKRRQRGAIDFPLVSCAVVLTLGESCARSARVVLGAVAPKPVLVEGVAQMLCEDEGGSATPRAASDLARAVADLAWKQAKPVENMLGVSAAWRRSTVRDLVVSAWLGLDANATASPERRST